MRCGSVRKFYENVLSKGQRLGAVAPLFYTSLVKLSTLSHDKSLVRNVHMSGNHYIHKTCIIRLLVERDRSLRARSRKFIWPYNN